MKTQKKIEKLQFLFPIRKNVKITMSSSFINQIEKKESCVYLFGIPIIKFEELYIV